MAGALSAPAELLAEDRSLPASIELHRVRVPLRTAHRSAHGTEHERDSVLVRWEHVDGAVGWGECPALTGDGYVTEPIDRAWTALRDDLAPAALRGVPPDPATVTAHPASTASIADARLDAVLRAHGRSLALDWGVSSSVRSTSVVALAGLAPQVVVERALAAVPASAVVKVKVVAGSAGELAEVVVDALGPTPVAVDANGSFDPDDRGHRSDLERLLALPLVYVEQPFAPAVPWDRWVEVASGGGAPLAVDESAGSVEAAARAVEEGAASVVSVKPARLGGLLAALEAARSAAAAGGRAFVGGMFELGVGRSAALLLAASGVAHLPTDLGPSDRYVEEDVTAPIVAGDPGRVVVPRGPGAASHPLPDRLERRRVAFHLVGGSGRTS